MTDDHRLYDINRQVGETLVMMGSVKGMLEDHKEIHEDIKELLKSHDERITSIEESRTWARAVLWVVGVISGAVGSVVSLVAKALAN